MLRPHSSSVALRRFLRFGALALAVAGCSRTTTATAPAGPSPTAGGPVGFVRMEELVKRHPMYAELSRLDDDMAALQLKAVGTNVAASPQELQRAGIALQRELDEATEKTKSELRRKQGEYAKLEQQAIAAALGATGAANGPSGGTIAQGIAQTEQTQAKAVASQAQANFDRYREAVVGQNRKALTDLQQSLSERASRAFRARLAELQKKEADYALQLASEDSVERLSLRTKLADLVLDDAQREDARKELDALNQKETDALAAMKNRDQAELATLQRQLRDQSSAELKVQASDLNKRTLAKLNQRELDTRNSVIGRLKTIAVAAPAAGGTVAVPGGLTPDMRAKLDALHKKYQQDFDKDANATVEAFQKTKSDITKRFQALQGVDADAQSGARKQLGALQKQRDQLYDEMVAQIGREVKAVAAKRGINVVLSDVVATGTGIDLTPDAEKDIESLHE